MSVPTGGGAACGTAGGRSSEAEPRGVAVAGAAGGVARGRVAAVGVPAEPVVPPSVVVPPFRSWCRRPSGARGRPSRSGGRRSWCRPSRRAPSAGASRGRTRRVPAGPEVRWTYRSTWSEVGRVPPVRWTCRRKYPSASSAGRDAPVRVASAVGAGPIDGLAAPSRSDADVEHRRSSAPRRHRRRSARHRRRSRRRRLCARHGSASSWSYGCYPQ